MSTNITPQKNRKSNMRNPRKFKIRDTFETHLVYVIVIERIKETLKISIMKHIHIHVHISFSKIHVRIF